MARLRQTQTKPAGGAFAIGQCPGQTLLAAVEIDRQYLATGIGQRDRQMESDGRLADTALLVGDGDDAGARPWPRRHIGDHGARMLAILGEIAAREDADRSDRIHAIDSPGLEHVARETRLTP